MGKITWTDSVRNEEVLHSVMEDRDILYPTKRRLTGQVTSCIGTVF